MLLFPQIIIHLRREQLVLLLSDKQSGTHYNNNELRITTISWKSQSRSCLDLEICKDFGAVGQRTFFVFHLDGCHGMRKWKTNERFVYFASAYKTNRLVKIKALMLRRNFAMLISNIEINPIFFLCTIGGLLPGSVFIYVEFVWEFYFAGMYSFVQNISAFGWMFLNEKSDTIVQWNFGDGRQWQWRTMSYITIRLVSTGRVDMVEFYKTVL